MHLKANKFKISSLAFILTAVFVCAPQLAQAVDRYKTRNMHFGVSGGNVNDHTTFFCCGGTLGSLVKTPGGLLYILSNNHVLARQDQAVIGEHITQPGLIDNSCDPAAWVAGFWIAKRLGHNVDCALAYFRDGEMDSTGFIEGYGGPPSSTTASPSVGMAVAKSGRTTGHTTGTIGSINTSVSVQYQIKCGEGKTYILNYTNQVVINSSTFGAGGDSGSLITTNNDSCYHPVALLFAGSSNTTIGNPIDEVLTNLSSRLGATLSFVGMNCTDSPSQPAGAQSFLSQQALDQASRVLEQNREDLMSKPAVLGVGLGALEDNSQPAIIVYVDKTNSVKPQLPAQIDNVPVRIIMTDPFVAFLFSGKHHSTEQFSKTA